MGKASNRKKKRRTTVRGFKPWNPAEFGPVAEAYKPDSKTGYGLDKGASMGKTVSIIKTRAVGKSITYAK